MINSLFSLHVRYFRLSNSGSSPSSLLYGVNSSSWCLHGSVQYGPRHFTICFLPTRSSPFFSSSESSSPGSLFNIAESSPWHFPNSHSFLHQSHMNRPLMSVFLYLYMSSIALSFILNNMYKSRIICKKKAARDFAALMVNALNVVTFEDVGFVGFAA